MARAIVEVEGLVKRYGGGDAPATEVLCGLDLRVEAGESLAVVGPSGSGKSTLLSILGALLPPTEGRVSVCGVDPFALDEDGRAVLRNEAIGFVFQDHHLLPQCSALENVLVPTLVRDQEQRRAAAPRARALLEEVGLAERAEHRPAWLSGGERQRVAVVRALVNGPRLVLADEPTGSLDRRNSERLGDLLCELNAAHRVALVVATHDLGLARRMGRVLELREGRLVTA